MRVLFIGGRDMIFNTGSGSGNVTADKVKYGDSNVAEALSGLEDIDVSLINSLADLDTKTDTMANAITSLENELTANDLRIYMDYKDGKYGYNTDPLRGADTFNPFNNGMVAKGIQVGWNDRGRQTITCGFRPSQVFLFANTGGSSTTLIHYDSRLHPLQYYLTFGNTLMLKNLRSSDDYYLYDITNNGFILNKATYKDWNIYWVAVG